MSATIEEATPPSESVRRRTGGRSARVRESVLRASVQAFTEVGLAGLNFSEIGRRAGVHATSVQRRWGSPENVLFEALVTYAGEVIRIPDTGSLRSDLTGFARSLADYFATTLGSAILQMLVTTAAQGGELTANRAEFVRLRLAATRAMIERAAQRGELRPGIDLDVALDLALGPIYVRTLITRQPIDDRFIEQFVELLLLGITAPTATTTAPLKARRSSVASPTRA